MTTKTDMDIDEILKKMKDDGLRRTCGEILLRTANYRHRRAQIATEVLKLDSLGHVVLRSKAEGVLRDFFDGS